MRVQRVLMPGTGFESWTVLGEDHMPVEPIERFLSYLASIEKSPNTIKAYAHDLKDWLAYLNRHGVDWRSARLEDVAGFVAWLRMPPHARDGLVAVLPTVAPHCSESSVNRKLSAVTSFCGFHARHGVELSGLLITMQPAGRRRGAATSYKPFLHHVSKRDCERRRSRGLTLMGCSMRTAACGWMSRWAGSNPGCRVCPVCARWSRFPGWGWDRPCGSPLPPLTSAATCTRWHRRDRVMKRRCGPPSSGCDDAGSIADAPNVQATISAVALLGGCNAWKISRAM